MDPILNFLHPLGLRLHSNGNVHSNSPKRHRFKQPSGQGEYNYKTTVQITAKVIRQGCQNQEKEGDRRIFVQAIGKNLIT